MEYIKESQAKLPVPFNLIPSVDAIKRLYLSMKNSLKKNTNTTANENDLSIKLKNITEKKVIKNLFSISSTILFILNLLKKNQDQMSSWNGDDLTYSVKYNFIILFYFLVKP